MQDDRQPRWQTALRWALIVVLALTLVLTIQRQHDQANIVHSWTEIRVAVVGPGSGDGAPDGLAFERGVDLYAQQLQADLSRPIRVEYTFFDDANDAAQAVEQAREIAAGGFHAVVGHKYSSCSTAAGAVYAEAGIPAISPTSTDTAVTDGNPWYFRTVYGSPRQGEFLAHYTTHVLDAAHVAVVSETLPYGAGIADAFEGACQEPCAATRHVFENRPGVDAPSLDQQLASITETLVLEQPDVVVLSTHATAAAHLVVRLSEAGYAGTLFGTNTLSSDAFLDAFPEGKRHLANGVHATAPLILDAGGPEVQAFRTSFRHAYGVEPDWRSATAYDAAALIVGVAEESDLSGDLASQRQAIRDGLAGLRDSDPSCATLTIDGVQGLSGTNCFDANGSPDAKDIEVGVFQSETLVSAPRQLQRVDPDDVPDLHAAIEHGNVLQLGGVWHALNDVVYVGFEVESVEDIDVVADTVQTEFLIWFRGPADDDIGDIVFQNAVGDVDMTLLQSRIDGLEAYELYKVRGMFWMDWDNERPDVEQYTLGYTLHHRFHSLDRLRFVADERGMAFRDDAAHLPIEWDLMGEVTEVTSEPIETLGDPALLAVGDNGPLFSQFSHRAYVQSAGLSLRRLTRAEGPPLILLSSLLTLALLGSLVSRTKRRPAFALVRLGQTVAAALALLTLEDLVIQGWWDLPLRMERLGRPELRQILTTFDVLWWLLPAAVLDRLVEEQIWVPLENRTRRIPNVVRRLGTCILFALAACGIIAFVFQAHLTSLVATSGVLTAVIGLGLQANLQNLFAGLSLNLEQPFRIGDRIRVGDGEPGRVVDITWRTTVLEMESGAVISVPNQQVSTTVLIRLPEDQPEQSTGSDQADQASPASR